MSGCSSADMQIEGMAELNTADDRRRSGETSTHGGLTNGHLKLHPDLHHLDGLRA